MKTAPTVQTITGLSEEQIFWMQVDNADKYLEHMGLDQWSRNILKESPKFWNWWKKQWQIRDEEYLDKCMVNPLDDTRQAQDMYDFIHAPDMLDIEPYRSILDESYQRMANEVIEEFDKSWGKTKAANHA